MDEEMETFEEAGLIVGGHCERDSDERVLGALPGTAGDVRWRFRNT